MQYNKIYTILFAINLINMREFLLNNVHYFIAIFFIWLLILTFFVIKFLKSWQKIFKKGTKNNLDEILKNQLEDIENIKISLEEIFEKIKKLKIISDKTIQKIGVIRFNPFQDMGSDQSFSIALLDSKNSGVVITSLTSRSGTRIYAKPIEEGESKYQLINEELEAIKKAKEFAVKIEKF